jgi:hypothetical protein
MPDIAGAAAGSTPYGAIAQTAVGTLQTIGGWIQQHKATKALEKLQSPTYNLNPYNTDLYRMQETQANRGLASGLSALQGRGQALAGVNQLVQGRNDNLLKAGATAEEMSRQDLNRLGQASGMKAGEEQTAFEINKQQPFESKYNLLAAKAAGGNQVANAGISNIFGGAQSYDQMRMLDKIYRK